MGLWPRPGSTAPGADGGRRGMGSRGGRSVDEGGRDGWGGGREGVSVDAWWEEWRRTRGRGKEGARDS